jgi:hypothetical protein
MEDEIRSLTDCCGSFFFLPQFFHRFSTGLRTRSSGQVFAVWNRDNRDTDRMRL